MTTPPEAAGREARKAPLTPLVRLLFWDYDRGSLPYELACVLVFLLLLLVPPGWWGDPLWSPR